jgi:uncharacterized protein
MKWRRVRSRDVIDQRGAGSGGGSGGAFGGGGFPIPIGRLGGGAGLVVLLLYLGLQLLGGGAGSGFDVGRSFQPGQQAPGAVPGNEGIPPREDPQRQLKNFSVYVFTNVQRSWEKTFAAEGKPYRHAELVLYSGAVNTGCGGASSAVGPFYCPADGRVYLDLSFYQELSDQLQAPGDFAWAYVIAHEMGHHVQDELGTSDEVDRERSRNPDEANSLSVRLELQADCYAGVWAGTVYASGDLQSGDLKEAVTASAAVGDDRLQRQATGSVNPDTFTHGTSEQRMKWLQTGYRSGDPGDCDTFSVEEP